MKKFIVLLTLVSVHLLVAPLFAQSPYSKAFGVRVGSANGLSYEQFFGRSNTAMEWLLVYRRGGARVIGMAKQYIPLTRHGEALLYFGLGGHAGMNGFLQPEDYNVPVVGIDAMAGLSYVFPYAPVILSVDLKPMVELYRGVQFSGNNAGVSLRFVID